MSQKSVLLRLLQEAGNKGVSVHELVYRRGITRAAAIVYDLKQEGYDIETLPGGPLPDGRTQLASYRLPHAQRTKPPTPPAGLFDDLPLAPGKPIRFDCGCIRNADGKGWESRCSEHGHKMITDAPVW